MIPLVARGIASLAGRLIARNPRLGKNIFSLLRKKPKGITLYRGEPAVPMMSAKETGKWMYGPGSSGIFTRPSTLKEAAVGRWFSNEPSAAMRFAGRGPYGWHPRNWKKMWEMGGPSGYGYQKGIVKKLKLSAKEAKLAGLVASRVSGGTFGGRRGSIPGYYIVPKSTLPRVETDAIRTAIANMKHMMGLKKGGLAKILNV